jgi:hypothetical protein
MVNAKEARMRALMVFIAAFSIGCGSAEGGGAAGTFDDQSAEAGPSTEHGSGFGGDAMSTEVGASEATGACKVDSDCDDHDECTVDVCERDTEGEFSTGLCGHADTPCKGDKKDGGASKPPPDTTLPPAVDTTCEPGCVAAKKTFPAATPLMSTAPATCTAGFEINNPKSGTTYTIKRVKGTGAVPIEVQFATYLAPDHIRLVGITATGEYPVVDTCTVQTATYADPTKGGCTRPPEDSIRQYAVTLKAGTTALRADFTGVCSPIYLRVRGLCDFDVTPFATTCKFREVP